MIVGHSMLALIAVWLSGIAASVSPMVLLAFPSNAIVADEPEPPWESGETCPAWADISPLQTLHLRYNPQLSDEQNGSALVAAVERLEPGDFLKIEHGVYSISQKFSVNLQGTADKPIWIAGASTNDLPIITRPDARQNVMNVGDRNTSKYVCFRHLELTGGSTLIRLYDCHHLWLDRCHLHHSEGEGITANAHDTSHLFVSGNHFHHFTHPLATGEAMYLGANHGKFKMSYSVIADNHVHDCGGMQGDGIEVKQGSHHNWIFRNHVHDTNYPCIIVYGTNGNGLNVIEQNTCYRSGDNVLQAQGEAIIRNNLLMAASGAAFASTDHQGKTTRLKFFHNTLISRHLGANLSSWNHREGMLFANNVIYTDEGEALRFPHGSNGVVIAGNVTLGRVIGADSGFIEGKGLTDFINVSWDAHHRSARFVPSSPLIGRADAMHSITLDINGERRAMRPTAGAFDSP